MILSPNEIEMNIRKGIINEIIMNSIIDDAIDISKVLDLFEILYKELEIYKYSGLNDRFKESLTKELNTNEHGLQAFLQEVIEYYGISIYDYIINKIK